MKKNFYKARLFIGVFFILGILVVTNIALTCALKNIAMNSDAQAPWNEQDLNLCVNTVQVNITQDNITVPSSVRVMGEIVISVKFEVNETLSSGYIQVKIVMNRPVNQAFPPYYPAVITELVQAENFESVAVGTEYTSTASYKVVGFTGQIWFDVSLYYINSSDNIFLNSTQSELVSVQPGDDTIFNVVSLTIMFTALGVGAGILVLSFFPKKHESPKSSK
ncbi:MAG: hypothetical protein ACTSRW_12620 [Candidatus Helarchaeota archaeon]